MSRVDLLSRRIESHLFVFIDGGSVHLHAFNPAHSETVSLLHFYISFALNHLLECFFRYNADNEKVTHAKHAHHHWNSEQISHPDLKLLLEFVSEFFLACSVSFLWKNGKRYTISKLEVRGLHELVKVFEVTEVFKNI